MMPRALTLALLLALPGTGMAEAGEPAHAGASQPASATAQSAGKDLGQVRQELSQSRKGLAETRKAMAQQQRELRESERREGSVLGQLEL